jgi:flavin-dependent dehydrogenase
VWDAIVVGARCAGAATATLLARKGYRVLLVDRDSFPSDIPHGHFIHRHGPRRLHAWGLLDRIIASGCPAVTSTTTDYGDFALEGDDLVVDGVPLGCGPRRSVLDRILVEAAVGSGAELRQDYLVEGISNDGDRVTGVHGRGRTGNPSTTERARITIGADGRRSRIARAVQAPERYAAPTVTCWYFSYWSDVPDRGIEIYVRGDRAIFVFPTNDNLLAIMIAWPIAMIHVVRSDVEGHFNAALGLIPGLAERVLSGRREEPFRGAADLPNFLRRPYGPGWALVGDAGCHKDPFMALGICDALRDAELLVEALDNGLSGRCTIDAALAEFESRRDAATMRDYQLNLSLACFEPPPAEMLYARASVRGDQLASNRLIMAIEGMIPQAGGSDTRNN